MKAIALIEGSLISKLERSYVEFRVWHQNRILGGNHSYIYDAMRDLRFHIYEIYSKR